VPEPNIEPFTTDHLLAIAAAQAANGILLLHVEPGETIPRILYANPEITATTGYAIGELIGRPITIFGGPESDLSVFDTFEETIMRGGVACARVLEYKKDGSTSWVEVSNRRIGDHPAGGTIMVSVRRNVDAETRLCFMVDACSDMISRHDAAGRFTYVSPSCIDVIGFAPEELLGTELSRYVVPEDLCHLHEPAGASDIYEATYRMRRKNGTPVCVEVRGRVVRGAGRNGPVRETHVFTRDVSSRTQTEADLRASERRYRSLFETNPCAMWIYDPHDLRFLAVNKQAVEQYGYSTDEFESMRLTDIRPTEDVPRMLGEMRRRHRRLHDHGAWRHRRKDGSLIDVHVTSSEIEWSGTAARLALLRNITEQKVAEAALTDYQRRLERSEKALAAAQAVAHIGSWDFDIKTREAIWSDELYRIYGITREQFGCVPGALWQFDHPDDVHEVRRQYEVAQKTRQPYSMIHRLVRPDGNIRWVHEIGRFEYDAEGQAIREVGTIQDVTEKKQAEDRLAFLAHFDTLTGLPNRVLLRDRLNQSISRANRDRRLVAVLFMDLDQFKQVNDTLGHTSGDQVLRDVAARLGSALRDSDTVCRYSGDEFIIILNDIEALEDVAAFATRVLAEITNPIAIDGREIATTASIGVSVYPNDGSDMDTLVKHADVAMYQAKVEGRNGFRFYQPAMQEAVTSRLSIQNDLRRALERDEFVLCYQPIVDLGLGRTIAAEALLRWSHPSRGLLPPSDFITVAEETGLIVPIGRWVLGRACADLARWRDEGLGDIDMNVNVAPRQFRSSELIDEVADALSRARVDARHLRLEITESLLMDNDLQALDIMSKLKSTGVQIELDDFGTGYSSLGRIGAFPIDGLKIDRSFVAKIVHDEHSRVIARAIIGLAKSLGLGVIAEGIETPYQVELLTAFGCTKGQGYFFSQPVPANEFAQRLGRQSAAERTRKSPVAKLLRRDRLRDATDGFEVRPGSNA
jgi:diguanylate cyclase (GGDEF)-like protein/PAS domain S-box-containing protein